MFTFFLTISPTFSILGKIPLTLQLVHNLEYNFLFYAGAAASFFLFRFDRAKTGGLFLLFGDSYQAALCRAGRGMLFRMQQKRKPRL